MSHKAQVTGQFALVNEASGTNLLAFDLASAFNAITGIQEHIYSEQQLSDTDGVVSLSLGGIGTIKGIFLEVVGGGTITFKHDSNTAGIVVENAMIIFGNFASPTIETSSTQALTVKSLMFE